MRRRFKLPTSRRYERLRQFVLRRDRWTCRKCGRVGGVLEVDHVRARHLGGDVWEAENMQVLCRRPCHEIKSIAESAYKKRLTRSKLEWGRAIAEQRLTVDLSECRKMARSAPQH